MDSSLNIHCSYLMPYALNTFWRPRTCTLLNRCCIYYSALFRRNVLRTWRTALFKLLKFKKSDPEISSRFDTDQNCTIPQRFLWNLWVHGDKLFQVPWSIFEREKYPQTFIALVKAPMFSKCYHSSSRFYRFSQLRTSSHFDVMNA